MEDRNYQEAPLGFKPKEERFQSIESPLFFRKRVAAFQKELSMIL
jgi:hypothetical protein